MIPSLIGFLYSAHRFYTTPRLVTSGESSGITYSRSTKLDWFVSGMWALACAYFTHSLARGLLKRWLVYYPVGPTIVRVLSLQAICWPLTLTTHRVLSFDQPVAAWFVCATTAAISNVIQSWVTSNIVERKDRRGQPSWKFVSSAITAVLGPGIRTDKYRKGERVLSWKRVLWGTVLPFAVLGWATTNALLWQQFVARYKGGGGIDLGPPVLNTTSSIFPSRISTLSTPASTNEIRILLLVSSSWSEQSRINRQTFRETSLELFTRSSTTSSVSLDHRFILGTAPSPQSASKSGPRLEEEATTYGDLLLVPARDSEEESTAKAYEGWRWARELDVHYVIKTEDDAFVRLDVIAKELVKLGKKAEYWRGFAYWVMPVLPQSEPSYDLAQYPPYTDSTLHILSHDLISLIAPTSSASRRITRNEDQSLGVWLFPSGIRPLHDHRIQHGQVCENDLIAKRFGRKKDSSNEAKEMYRNIVEGRKLCEGIAQRWCGVCYASCRKRDYHWKDAGIVCDEIKGATVSNSKLDLSPVKVVSKSPRIIGSPQNPWIVPGVLSYHSSPYSTSDDWHLLKLIVWTEPSSAFNDRHFSALETIFVSEPRAVVLIFSTTLDDTSFDHYRDMGYTIHVVKVGKEEMLEREWFVGRESERWIRDWDKWKDGPNFNSHLADYLRYLFLFKFGGTSIDLDALWIRSPPHSNLEFVGTDRSTSASDESWTLDEDGTYLSNRVIRVKSGWTLFQEVLESTFSPRYSPDCLECTGSRALTIAYQPRRHQLEMNGLTLLPPHVLYPRSWIDSHELVISLPPGQALERLAEWNETWSIHLFSKMTSQLPIQRDSIAAKVIDSFSLQAHSDGTVDKAGAKFELRYLQAYRYQNRLALVQEEVGNVELYGSLDGKLEGFDLIFLRSLSSSPPGSFRARIRLSTLKGGRIDLTSTRSVRAERAGGGGAEEIDLRLEKATLKEVNTILSSIRYLSPEQGNVETDELGIEVEIGKEIISARGTEAVRAREGMDPFDSDDEDLAVFSPNSRPAPAPPRNETSSRTTDNPFSNTRGTYDPYGQSQNPASYGGGRAANQFGTAVDVSNQSLGKGGYDDYNPFYDDDEDLATSGFGTSQPSLPYDSRPEYGRNGASYSHDESLTANAQKPAGFGQGRMGEPSRNMLDEDDEEIIQAKARLAAMQAKQSRRKGDTVQKVWEEVRRILKGGPKVYEGERVIHLNNPTLNAANKYSNNSISTSKYNFVTFLPKFLAEQFSKYANIFFLFTACIQQIPNVSPTNRYTTILPLGIVLIVAALKEAKEDIKRHQSDADLNTRKAKVLEGSSFVDKPWRSIRVGDIVRVESNESFPADLVILSSSEPEGLCYIETSNLDGETNLKIKQAHSSTANLLSPAAISQISGQLRSEQPNNSLYTFEATLSMSSAGLGTSSKDLPLGPDQILLRGAQLRNTAWLYGIVIFTGHETKLMRNATAAPIKRTAMERMVNVQILFLLGILLALSIGCAIGATVRNRVYADQMWYLYFNADANAVSAGSFIKDVLTFILTLNNLIPISLIVTMEVVKFQQAAFINSDLDMYYAATDTPALCRTSSLVEELGQIEYIFSDKTGTLTCNQMEFRQCSIGGVPYSDLVEEAKKGEVFSFSELRETLSQGGKNAAIIDEFLTLLATCHTVIPEMKDEKIVYQASSPDEAALVSGADVLGYTFKTRKPQSVFVEINGREKEYQVLNILEFNSTRKRMSSIIRTPEGKIKLYCKGADTVIFERLAAEGQVFNETTSNHLEEYATEGLRTLCIAMREIPEEEYKKWVTIYDRAAATINGRTEALDKASEIIERDLFLLGATAIEDKLQDGVPDTIYTLQQAGIKIWVLTGDRQETAINIGLSCRLISESMSLVIVNEENALDTRDFLTKRLEAVKNSRSAGDFEELALVIDGKSLSFALEKDLSKTFLELAVMCKAVVCCRVSPLQKALVVKLVKKNLKAILLAIGDGANDVSMIQAAHVGVGISGVEGLQAARSADVAISQFRYLKKLLLVHGTWSYQRLSKLILYSFYKNIALYMTGFWFAFQNSFSGQVLEEGWTLTFYNVVFTVLPPIVLGVFDQFVGARMLDRYPELYKLGQQNKFFSVRIFWQWIINALVHSFVIYVVTVAIFWDGLALAQGWIGGQWVWGTTLYLSALLTVLAKAALISDIWTKYTLLAIPGSFVFTMGFLPLYAWIAPMLGFSREYTNIVGRLWSSLVFWLTIFGLPFLLLTRDFAWKSYKRLFRPEPYHIVQEIQKYNLPDYRPRMEQFQKAIKKVRAVQRLRRNRGFAFSQTEEGQEHLIRAYDTSKGKPSGT
ncbi:uncharacterized protein JCM6883_002941 [Sporobolomyces salmoneus]|uniref:uncharacterized protein n=1 Tax=Sporobolomyces salmoneus TaxID=183962 RepID=UPI00316EFA22